MVAIKDMEMPTTCNECKLRSVSMLYHQSFCTVTGKTIRGDIKTDKDKRCPLMEVEECTIGNTNTSTKHLVE